MVGADGDTSIGTVKQTLTHKTYGDAELELSGKFVDGVLTLNMTVTQGETKAVYVYTGAKKLTGYAIEKMTIDNSVVVVQPEFGDIYNYSWKCCVLC